jgi:hypothetical protein
VSNVAITPCSEPGPASGQSGFPAHENDSCPGSAAVSSSAKSGRRSNSTASDCCNSSRASGAPMQKCRPAPKLTFFWSERPGRNSCGASKADGSRLAAPRSNANLLARLERHRPQINLLIGVACEHVQRRIKAQGFLDCWLQRAQAFREEPARIAALFQNGLSLHCRSDERWPHDRH